ncbi:hypothetical protein BKE30_10430 [Alkanindiges hydrocarboniclasticus]|jgi:hypothetical protein|uniref:Uncharacterized protein n=1 Tax=Alkanindiges hydrocarboniclasticus TaxID=1907941 RepID=A0A1S8CV48_9GAMM|nr:hypothetical protein [Alkanindiges hydrocarboniclasticus]ONG39175.1 hypothetical protein BKE30_10430 [Alkanindiges hydrocarboniclasticus]
MQQISNKSDGGDNTAFIISFATLYSWNLMVCCNYLGIDSAEQYSKFIDGKIFGGLNAASKML